MRVLMIEDDAATAQSMELMLRAESFSVDWVDRGDDGLDLAQRYGFDAILLDINLPDISGFEVLKRLRVDGIDTAIIIVSGLAAIADKVKGLNLGADDYMTKPFHRDELVARIHAVVRRRNGHAKPAVRAGNMVVDLVGRKVTVNGAPLHLTGKEHDLIEFLALRKGNCVTKEACMDRLYNDTDEPDDKIIDVFVCKLRKKLSAAGVEGAEIATKWGKGFALEEKTA